MGQSRTEDILEATINDEPYTEPPRSRVEELLLELKEVIEQGGGGGTIVIANPQGEPSEVLQTIQIGSVIFSIAGSSGNATGVKVVDKLYEASTGAGAPLSTDISYLNSHNLTDYDYITVVLSDSATYAQGNYTQVNSFAPESLMKTPGTSGPDFQHPLLFTAIGNRSCNVAFYKTNFRVLNNYGDNEGEEPSIFRIYGVKLGTSDVEIEANPEGEATETLEKLRVGDNIYGVEGGTDTKHFEPILLFETDALTAPTINTPIDYIVDDDFFDFDLITIQLYAPGDIADPVSILSSGTAFCPKAIKKLDNSGVYKMFVPGYSARTTDFVFNSHYFMVTAVNAPGEDASRCQYPYKIYGYKFNLRINGNISSEFTDDILYESTAAQTGTLSITLNERLDAYDAIYFEYFFPSESTYTSANPSPIYRLIEGPAGTPIGKYFVQSYPSYGNRYISISSPDGGKTATLVASAWGGDSNPSVYKIHGIKFNPQRSQSYKIDTLWSGEESPGSTKVSVNLANPINEYDTIVIEGYSTTEFFEEIHFHDTLIAQDILLNKDYFDTAFDANANLSGCCGSWVKFTTRKTALLGLITDSSTVTYTAIKGIRYATGVNRAGGVDVLYQADTSAGAPVDTNVNYFAGRRLSDYDTVLVYLTTVGDYASTPLISGFGALSPRYLPVKEFRFYGGYGSRLCDVIFEESYFCNKTALAPGEADTYIPHVYAIVGVKSTVSEGVREDYSLDENRIGTWIDGRDLYRKTITVPNFSTNQNTGNLYYGNFDLSDYIDVDDYATAVIGCNLSKSYIRLASDDTTRNVAYFDFQNDPSAAVSFLITEVAL